VNMIMIVIVIVAVIVNMIMIVIGTDCSFLLLLLHPLRSSS